MKNGFFYEPNCVENGEWIPEKETLEDMLVLDLRRSWKHRHNLIQVATNRFCPLRKGFLSFPHPSGVIYL